MVDARHDHTSCSYKVGWSSPLKFAIGQLFPVQVPVLRILFGIQPCL